MTQPAPEPEPGEPSNHDEPAEPAKPPWLHRQARGAARALGLCGYGAALATVLGDLGHLSWVLDLFAPFRLQYALVLAPTLLLYALRRRWLHMIVPGCALVANLAALAPLWLPTPGSHGPALGAAPGRRLTLVSFNVHWNNPHPDRVLAYLDTFAGPDGPDVIALLEIPAAWVPAIAERFPDHQLLHADRQDPFALAVLARPPLRSAQIVHLADDPIPAAELVLDRAGARVAVLVVHPPPPVSADMAARRDRILAAAGDWAAARTEPAVIAGDLNLTPWSHAFADLLARGHLQSSHLGFGYQATWPVSPWPLRIPIDHLLHSPALITTARTPGLFLGSDHRPLQISLALSP
ncbi:endonuclease/exonuclease/phosphatase family protein [Haliangium sp.]|uniref:endonuclease/exonuclease/phosphatase family protein n=1 Tax=Haliangium sp. TaxID=2663208 RepID=UPI003D0D14C0